MQDCATGPRCLTAPDNYTKSGLGTHVREPVTRAWCWELFQEEQRFKLKGIVWLKEGISTSRMAESITEIQ